MRDNTIRQMEHNNAKRSQLLLDQFEFLQTRMEAVERLVKVSTLRARIVWLFSPAQFLRAVDAIHLNLMSANRAMVEAEKAKVKIARL